MYLLPGGREARARRYVFPYASMRPAASSRARSSPWIPSVGRRRKLILGVPGVVQGFEALDHVRVCSREVLHLTRIAGEVGEKEGVGIGKGGLVTRVVRVADELPVARADGLLRPLARADVPVKL